jgi:hypothetical protein
LLAGGVAVECLLWRSLALLLLLLEEEDAAGPPTQGGVAGGVISGPRESLSEQTEHIRTDHQRDKMTTFKHGLFCIYAGIATIRYKQ